MIGSVTTVQANYTGWQAAKCTDECAAPRDAVELGGSAPLVFRPMPGQPIHVAEVPQGWTGDEKSVADQLLSHMKAWPSLHATVAMAPSADGNTRLMIADPADAASESQPEGAMGITAYLAGSPTVKAAASCQSLPYEQVAQLDEAGLVHELRVPGQYDASSLGAALTEGQQPNRKEMLKSLVEGLPQGKRVALLLAGPSGAGKTSIINELKGLAGDRKVTVLTGDMYFRDMDDPDYPRTAQGSFYWDSPEAMHMQEMGGDIARLIGEGKADLPIYDFAVKRPGGWRNPVPDGVSGIRLDKKEHVELGGDDILVIDSLHASNDRIIDQLKDLGLPHATLYLDSSKSEDRLLRRIVRDYQSRGGSAERTVEYWDLTTFPGESHFVRPTLLNLDTAQDLYYVNRFATDLGLSRPEIEHKVSELAKYGLAPTYEAFGTADSDLPALARKETARFEGIVASSTATDAEKAAAQKELDKLRAAQK